MTYQDLKYGKLLRSEQMPVFLNDSDEDMPAYAVMKVVGANYLSNGKVVIKCDVTDKFGSQYDHIINGSKTVESGKTGFFQTKELLKVYWVDDEDPKHGDALGPHPDAHSLGKNIGGFRVFGDYNTALDADAKYNNLIVVHRQPMWTLRVELDEDCTQGDTVDATPTYYNPDTDSWAKHSPPFTISVKEAIGTDKTIPEGTVCWCNHEQTSDMMCIVSAECVETT